MHPSLAIAAKDLRLLARDRVNFFFTFIFPLIYGILFGLMFSGGGSSSISIALADLDQTPRSAALVESIKAVDGVNLLQLPSEAQAIDLVRKGKRTACVVIPKGYADAAANIFSGNPATLRVLVDPARKAESGLIQGKLTELAFRQLVTQFTDPDEMLSTLDNAVKSLDNASASSDGIAEDLRSPLRSLLDSATSFTTRLRDRDTATPNDNAAPKPAADASSFMPIQINIEEVQATADGPASSFDITLPQAVAWGLLGAVMAFGVSLVQERTQGTLARLSASPLSGFDIMLGKALACFVTALIVQAFLILTFALFFHVRPVAPLILLLAVVAASFCFSGIMVVLAVLGKTEGGSSGMGRAVLLLLTIFGGGAIPLMFMPPWMQSASGISPFKWAIVALEGGIWRSFTLAEALPSLGILLAVGTICFAIGARLFRRLQLG
jgi:ABC-2 type transport system permease protein